MANKLLGTEAREEMLIWLGTLSTPQNLRENPGSRPIEQGIVEEALYKAGARSAKQVAAVFHHLKTQTGLNFWPNTGQIAEAVRVLKATAASQRDGPSDKGSITALSFEDQVLLRDVILPKAREFLAVPGLRPHGEATLEYWGENID